MTPLRLLTWNLHGSATPPLNVVAEVLRAQAADVLVLQEVRRGQAARLAGLLGWPRPVWARKHNAYWPLWWRAEGLAVLSPLRLAPHPPVVLTPGVSWRSYRRRIVLAVEVGEPAVLVLDVHLASADAVADRAAQAAATVALVPAGMPAVVAGDLNAVPSEPACTVLVEAGFADAWRLAGGDPAGGATCPANAPRVRLDQVWVRDVPVTGCRVVDDLGAAMSGLSDHRPVVADLLVAEPPADLPSAP